MYLSNEPNNFRISRNFFAFVIALRIFSLFLIITASFILCVSVVPPAEAQERVLIPYGGHNETVATMWVGIEKGLFNKYGLDARMLQVRSGPLIMATLSSGSVQVVWPALSSVLSAVSGGLKVSCVAESLECRVLAAAFG